MRELIKGTLLIKRQLRPRIVSYLLRMLHLLHFREDSCPQLITANAFVQTFPNRYKTQSALSLGQKTFLLTATRPTGH